MTPVAMSVMPTASATTPRIANVRKRRGRPEHPMPEATRERKESARPIAARSCMAMLKGIGMRPTMVRCAPAEASDARIQTERRRPMPAGRSAPTTAA